MNSPPFCDDDVNVMTRRQLVVLSRQYGWLDASAHRSQFLKKFLTGKHPNYKPLSTPHQNINSILNVKSYDESPISSRISDDGEETIIEREDYMHANKDPDDEDLYPPPILLYRLTTEQLQYLVHTYQLLSDISDLTNLPVDIKFSIDKLIASTTVYFGNYSHHFQAKNNKQLQKNFKEVSKKVVPYSGTFNPLTLPEKVSMIDNKRIQLIFNYKGDPISLFNNIKTSNIHLNKYAMIIKENKILLLLEGKRRYQGASSSFFDITISNASGSMTIRPIIYSIPKKSWKDAVSYYKGNAPIVNNFE